MTNIPDFTPVCTVLPESLAARVERERAAHADSRIDVTLRKWWDRFPHVFSNPAAQKLDRLYEFELGDPRDKVVLEYGCGTGAFAAWMYGRGAQVIGIDISNFNIVQSEARFLEMGADPQRFRFAVMDAHALQLPDQSVDIVSGNGILHHLDLDLALAEVRRVLKPGGKAMFFEPLVGNPILKIYRLIAQYQTDDERPLGKGELTNLRRRHGAELHFSGVVTLPVAALTSFVAPNNPCNWALRLASWVEGHVNKLRSVETWNRITLIVFDKARNA